MTIMIHIFGHQIYNVYVILIKLKSFKKMKMKMKTIIIIIIIITNILSQPSSTSQQ